MDTYELYHYLKRKRQGKHGVADLKIDMEKAYDKVEWRYLEGMLTVLGFDTTWITQVMTCISTVNYCVLMQGQEVGPIQPQRGLRQGDLLSPYMFIICAVMIECPIEKV